MESADERYERLRRLDAAHVWHPFTQMEGWTAEEPLIIERAEGRHLVDVRGVRYLDGVSSLWCNVHGHRVPAIDAAIREQLDRVAHTTLLGQASPPSIELAARLAQIAPAGLTRVFFSDSGSTAVEVALKLAFQFFRQNGRPEKRAFAALAGAYHGDTLGSVSIGAIDLFHSMYEPLLFERYVLPSPYSYRPPQGHDAASWADGCIRAAEKLVDEKGDELAAVVIEPIVQGAAGMILQPHGYLARLAEACRRKDVLLVCDEVATGFGRTGRMFAVEHEGVTPDLLCVAKGLTGGYLPLAATLATERIHEGFLGSFASQRTFFHGHTFTGNPLACAAALASLELFQSERVLERLQPKIVALTRRLAPLTAHRHVGQIRQRGLMVGIELVRDKATKEPYSYGERIGHQVILRARAHGVILRPLGNVVVLMPPLAITAAELELLCDVTVRSIEEATSAAAPR